MAKSTKVFVIDRSTDPEQPFVARAKGKNGKKMFNTETYHNKKAGALKAIIAFRKRVIETAHLPIEDIVDDLS